MATNILNILPQYQALSADEIYKPFELYTTAMKGAMSGYSTLGTQAHAIGQMLQVADEEKDANLIQSYQDYMDNLSSMTDDLMHNGYSQNAEWKLNKAQAQYAAMATPITTAYQARAKDIEAYNTAMAKDNTLMAAYDPTQSSLSDYINGMPKGNVYVSGKELREQAAKLGASISKREEKISTGLINLLNNVSDTENWYHMVQKTTGYSNNYVTAYINNLITNGYGGIPELDHAINYILNNNQLSSGLFTEEQQAAGLNQIIQGFIEGIVYDIDKPSFTKINLKGSGDGGSGDDLLLPPGATAITNEKKNKNIDTWEKLLNRIAIGEDKDLYITSDYYTQNSRSDPDDLKQLHKLLGELSIDPDSYETGQELKDKLEKEFYLYKSQSATIGYRIPLHNLGIKASDFIGADLYKIKNNGNEEKRAIQLSKLKLNNMTVQMNTGTHRIEIVGDIDDDSVPDRYTPANPANVQYKYITDADKILASFDKPSEDDGWNKDDDGNYYKVIDKGNIKIVRSESGNVNTLYISNKDTDTYNKIGQSSVQDEIYNNGEARMQLIIKIIYLYFSQKAWS